MKVRGHCSELYCYVFALCFVYFIKQTAADVGGEDVSNRRGVDAIKLHRLDGGEVDLSKL